MFEKSVFANKLVIYVNVCVRDLHFNINKCSQIFTINKSFKYDLNRYVYGQKQRCVIIICCPSK